MSMPSLHCPVVSASVPSASITASSKKAAGCARHTRTRVWLIALCNASIAASSNRRQKSPAVVGIAVLVLHIARSVHRRRLCRPRPRSQASLDSPFAPRHILMFTRLHSKCPPVSELLV